jgi:cell division initiation protein
LLKRPSTFLTPVEIQHVDLGRAMRGYDPAAVDALLEDAVSSYEHVWLERDALRDRLVTLEQELGTLRERERLLGEVLGTGHALTEQLRARARSEGEAALKKARSRAASIVSEALAERDRLFAELDRLRAAEAEFRAQSRKLHTAALALMDGEAPDTDPEPGNGRPAIAVASAQPAER